MKKPIYILFLLLSSLCLSAQPKDSLQIVARYKDGTRIYSDTAIYQGMSIKLDLVNPILEVARNKGKLQAYELALNWKLKQRFYPTLELGGTFGQRTTAEGQYNGAGGFFRAGMDINALKKHPESRAALLAGLRIASAMQQYNMHNVTFETEAGPETRQLEHRLRADCWGEIGAGCQVQIWEGLLLGWAVRYKILFTRKHKEGDIRPLFIPGFGNMKDTNWGFQYYIGYTF